MTDKITNMSLKRRSFLQASLAASATLAAPAIISSKALASSGELNLMGWSGYNFDELFATFTKETGIKINFQDQPDQDSMYAKCKVALQTGGVDIVEPTVDRTPSWASNGIIQPWDDKKIKIDNFEEAFVTGRAGEAAVIDGKRYFMPSAWGSESLIYSTEEAPMTYPEATLASLFDDQYDGKVTFRVHAGLAAMGRVLDAQGKLPKPFLEGYKDEASMRQIWDVVLAEAIKHKGNYAQFWNGENDAQAAFRTNGCTIGLCWDTTGLNLVKEKLPFGYISPKEGAFAYMQGYFLMRNAVNVEQAVEFANFISSKEGSALNAKAFGSNAVGKGSTELLDADFRAFTEAAFPGDALTKLWWWPAQDAWFIKLRSEYVDKLKSA